MHEIIVICILLLVPLAKSAYSFEDATDACGRFENKDGCTKIGSKYFYIESTKRLNWFAAEQYCVLHYGNLITIQDHEELEAIDMYLKLKIQTENVYWTSGNDLVEQDRFVSSTTKESLPFIKWNAGLPNTGSNKHCITLKTRDGNFGMEDSLCSANNSFICEFEETIVTKVPTACGDMAADSGEKSCLKIGEKYLYIERNNKLNWFAAGEYCRNYSSNLITISNFNEWKAINEYFLRELKLTDPFWTSGNDLADEGIFVSSSTKATLPFSKWNQTQPDDYDGTEECVHLYNYGSIYAMNDIDCSDKYFFICEFTNERKVPTTTSASDTCNDFDNKDGGIQIGEKHYLIEFNDKLNWFAAQQYCVSQNSNLTTIQSIEELDALSNYFNTQTLNATSCFWTSGNDLADEGTYVSHFTNKRLPFIKWHHGQPNSTQSGEDCIYISSYDNKYAMNVADCDNECLFICGLPNEQPID